MHTSLSTVRLCRFLGAEVLSVLSRDLILVLASVPGSGPGSPGELISVAGLILTCLRCSYSWQKR